MRRNWLVLFILWALALLVFFCSSCSPEKRIQHIMRHNPGLSVIDTLRYHDTLIIREKRVDTLFYYAQHDTIIKQENGAVIKYFFNSKDSTVFLEGKCKGDTIIREIHIPYKEVNVTESALTWGQKLKLFIWDWVPLAILLCVIFFWFRFEISKRN